MKDPEQLGHGKEALPRGVPRKRNRKLQRYEKPQHVIRVKDSPRVKPPSQYSKLKLRPVYKVNDVDERTHGDIRHLPKKRHKGQIMMEFANEALERVSNSHGAEGGDHQAGD